MARHDAIGQIAVAAMFLTGLGAANAGDAKAHGASSGSYRSRVTAVAPSNLPVRAEVTRGDEMLRVSNRGSRMLVVYGYQSAAGRSSGPEQYLRILPTGVFVNRNSRTYHLNTSSRGGDVPAGAGSGPPRWVKVSGKPTFAWHDHRIHWMGTQRPPNVVPADTGPQRVFAWTVPIRYGGSGGSISGRLDYLGSGRAMSWRGIVALGATALLALVLAARIARGLLRRRTRVTIGGGDNEARPDLP